MVLPAALLAAQALPAPTGQWVHFFESQGAHYYYDSGSLSRDGDMVRVRVRLDHSGISYSRLSESRDIWQFDCANRRWMIRRATDYLRDGTVAFERDFPAEASRFHRVGDAADLRVYRILCPDQTP